MIQIFLERTFSNIQHFYQDPFFYCETFLHLYGFELFAALLSLWCVILAAKNSIYNWPIAMIGSAMYVVVFFRSSLYSDAVLNAIFLLFQAYGWFQWLRKNNGLRILNGPLNTDQAPIFAGLKAVSKVLLLGLICYYPWVKLIESGALQSLFSNAVLSPPRFLYIDAALLMLSLSALYMQAHKWIESWWIWIVVDVVYVPVYFLNDISITGMLYLFYIPVAYRGYLYWKDLRADEDDQRENQ